MKRFTTYKLQLVKESTALYEPSSDMIRCSDDARRIAVEIGYENFADEVFGLFCLNTKGIVVGYHEVSHGDVTGSLAHPREIFKRAMLNNATSIIVVHNHPSGDSTPSVDDIETARRIADAGKLMGIPLLDSLVIGFGCYTSLKADGVI